MTEILRWTKPLEARIVGGRNLKQREIVESAKMTGTQCQAARLRLGWSTRMLASKAGVPWFAVINFDYGTGNVDPDVVDALVRTFKQAGVELR